MNEKGLSVLEQYDLKIIRTFKGRGCILCETNQGLKLLKELNCYHQRVEFQNEVLNLLKNSSDFKIDGFVKTSSQELIAKDKDEYYYIVKDWYEGRECDVLNEQEILLAVKKMGKMHNTLILSKTEAVAKNKYEDLREEFEKHNKELKKVRSFIRDKNNKSNYEICFIHHFEGFWQEGSEATSRLKNSSYEAIKKYAENQGRICHGDYNHHNILILNRGGIAIVNFDKCYIGIQTGDLYHFMRKIMEKHNWSIPLGKKMLKSYQEVRPLSEEEKENLFLRFLYPEKFWKLANHYYNSNKAWMPAKNIEKLELLVEQNRAKRQFLTNVFENYMENK